MTEYEKADLAGRIELASKRLLEAARKRNWEEFDRQWQLTARLRSQINGKTETRILGTVALAETADTSERAARNVTY